MTYEEMDRKQIKKEIRRLKALFRYEKNKFYLFEIEKLEKLLQKLQ